MKVQSYDVLILSDLHLGSKASRAGAALQVIKKLKFRRLILLGDIFCDLNFARLNKEHWQFLSCIRKLSNPKRSVEVIWIEGNHDYGLTDVMSHLVGVPVYREFLWESDGIWNLAVHGHQFDRLILKDNSIVNRFVSNLHLSIQKVEPRGMYLTKMIDSLGARWQRLTPRVAREAISYAKSRGAARVFCGHTHEPAIRKEDTIEYFNAGAWTGGRPTFITLHGQEVRIHEYNERINGYHPGKKRRNFAAPVAGVA